MNKPPLTVDCPTCKNKVTWGEQSPFRPFCSKRCQLIDLGEWNDEQHRIASQPEQPDFDAMTDEELETYVRSQNSGMEQE